MQQSTRFLQGLRALHISFQQPAISRRASSRLYSQHKCHFPRPTPPTRFYRSSRIAVPSITARFNSNTSTPGAPLTDRAPDPDAESRNEEQNRLRREQEPAYQLTFTCKPCGARSSHRVSKHGYHRGTVLIRCSSCSNRHVISDHLNIFFDQSKTLEDLLSEQGQKITRGQLQGDLEFWDDGSVRKRSEDETKSN